MRDRLSDLEAEFSDLEVRMGDPALLADQRRYASESRRYKQLEAIVSRARRLREVEGDVEAARELSEEATGEERAQLKEEIAASEAAVAELEEELRVLLLPRDPNDDKNVIVEIRGAEGGEEANLFARDLYEMYRAYATRQGFKVEAMSASPSPMGGYNEVVFRVAGDGAWSRLKWEAGPHRVQRVPATEAQGRVHTSAATVSVLPEAEEVDVAIDPNDLQVDVYRSSGAGGQHVNTTDSAVRITHRPTGLVVTMQDEKSQLQNRAKAMTVLRSRLLKLEADRLAAERSGLRREQVGGGGRSEKIRTYNFKENRVTDHRIGLTLYKLDRVLGGGELDDVLDALSQDERARQLAEG
ncbi:MAG: peptide chain release factor 1 [Acidimicrobiia bacterium]|nr:peptide chain release factor 1 [Acidimicrobiia bacterium]